MARSFAGTDVADVRDSVKDSATSAFDTVKTQAASAGETLAAAASSALDAAAEQTRRSRKKARKRAQELADEAAKSAKKSAKSARKRANKASTKAGKKARKRAEELSVAVQQKAGRKPRRGRKVAAFGGLALAGVFVAGAFKRKQAASNDPYATPSPTANTGSGLPGDPGPTA